MPDPVDSLYAIRTWLEQRPEAALIAGIWIVITVLYCLLAIFKVGRGPGPPRRHFRLIAYAGNVVLAIGAFVAVIYLIPRYMLDSAQATVRSYAERVNLVEPYPLRWTPADGGAVKLVRFQGDRIQIETQNPGTSHRPGEFLLAELHRREDKYAGATESRFTCVLREAGRQSQKDCNEELAIEITSVAPRRIEGRVQVYPARSTLQCQTCSHSASPVWQPFIWTPE